MVSLPRTLKTPHAILAALLQAFNRPLATRRAKRAAAAASAPVQAPKRKPSWTKRSRWARKAKKGTGKGKGKGKKGKKADKSAGSGLGLFVECVHESFGIPFHEDGTTAGNGTRGEGGAAVCVAGPDVCATRACVIKSAGDAAGGASTSEERFYGVALGRVPFAADLRVEQGKAVADVTYGPASISAFAGITPSPSIASGLAGLANTDTNNRDTARCAYTTLSRCPYRLRPSAPSRRPLRPRQRQREDMPILLESDSEEDYGQVISTYRPRYGYYYGDAQRSELRVINTTPVIETPPSSPASHHAIALKDAQQLEGRAPLVRPGVGGTTVGVGLGVGDVPGGAAAIVVAAGPAGSCETLSTVPSGWSALASSASSVEALCGGLVESATTIYSTSSSKDTASTIYSTPSKDTVPTSAPDRAVPPSSVLSSGSEPCAGSPLVGEPACLEHAHVASTHAYREVGSTDFANEGPEMDITDYELDGRSSYDESADECEADEDASIRAMHRRSLLASTPSPWLADEDAEDASCYEFGYSFGCDRTYRSMAPSPSPRRVYGAAPACQSTYEDSVEDYLPYSAIHSRIAGRDGDDEDDSRNAGNTSARSARGMFPRSPFWFFGTPVKNATATAAAAATASPRGYVATGAPATPRKDDGANANTSLNVDDLWLQMRDALAMARDGARLDPAKYLASRICAPRTPRTPLRKARFVAVPSSLRAEVKIASVERRPASVPRRGKYAAPETVWWSVMETDLSTCM